MLCFCGHTATLTTLFKTPHFLSLHFKSAGFISLRPGSTTPLLASQNAKQADPPELVLGHVGFFWPSYHLLDNSSSHVADENVLNILRLNSNPPCRIISMEVNDPDLDAFESSTHAQLRARELGKIEASNSQSSAKHSCPCVDGKIGQWSWFRCLWILYSCTTSS